MAILRATFFAGLVTVACIGVPGAHAAEPDPDAQTDEDAVVTGGGACNGGAIGLEALAPLALAAAGVALRRRR